MTAKILIVDDDPAFRRLVVRVLRQEYTLEQAEDGAEALRVMGSFVPDVVLLDIGMPGIDGYETCRRIKATAAGQRTQVIMVSAQSSREEQLRAYEQGADDYLVKPIDVQELRCRAQLHVRMREALQNVSSIRQEIASRNQEIKQLAEQRARDLLLLQDVVVYTLAKVAESRDCDTGGHVLRVRSYCQRLAEALRENGPYSGQIDGQFMDDLYRASPLHDIGKVAIPDEILLKPGRLTAAEFQRMQQHTVIGAGILEEAIERSPYAGFLAMAAVVARYHHERYDGSGYPAGLAGLEIPLPARILAVADAYDAITSERPYKAAETPHRAKEIIQSESGRHFDPVIVEAFRARFADFLQVGNEQSQETLSGGNDTTFCEQEPALIEV